MDQAAPDACGLAVKWDIDLDHQLVIHPGHVEPPGESPQGRLIRDREHDNIGLRGMLAETAGGMGHLSGLETARQVISHHQVLGRGAGVNVAIAWA